MSETEHYKGKLVPILHKSAEDICKEYYGKSELDKYYDSWEEMLKDIGYREEYQVLNGVLYKVHLIEHEESDSIFEGELKSDGTIDVHLRFYNGGCSLTEALELCIEDAERHFQL